MQYSNTIYVSRAIDTEGFNTKVDNGYEVALLAEIGAEVIKLTLPVGGSVTTFLGDFISFGMVADVFQVIAVDAVNSTITLDNPIMDESIVGTNVYNVQPHMNSVVEVGENAVLIADADVYMNRSVIKNGNDFEMKQTSIAKTGALKLIAKNPGAWSLGVDIAIASEADFASGTTEAFPGINLNGLYQYIPNADNLEFGVIVKYGENVAEAFLVSLKEGSKDFNGKSNFIEDVINRQSQYLFCVYSKLADHVDPTLYLNSHLDTNALSMKFGANGTVAKANLMDAYDMYSDKELIDIDIVIIPEEMHGEGIDFCTKRADVIGYFGAKFEDVVGVKSTVAVSNLVTYITSTLNKSSKYVSFVGNYEYIYDYRLVA